MRRRWLPSFWEVILVLLTLAAGGWSARLSPYYLSFDQIANSSRQFIIPGLLALGLSVVVVVGEIDISLGSTLAVGTVLFSKCSEFHLPVAVAVFTALLICALLGMLNGLLVARLGLPSLAVTLGTMGAYRGFAFIVGSERGYTDFGDSYLWLGSEALWQETVPVSFLLFLLSAGIIGFLLHRTVFGRRCFSIGHNAEACRFAGIDVSLHKIAAFTLAGVLAALGASVWIGQYGSARGDNADGMILFVVTAVVLGGVDIRGGRGSVLGVIFALFLLGTLRNGMGLANIPGPTQTVVLGSLLLAGVLQPVFFSALARFRRSRRRPALGPPVELTQSDLTRLNKT